MASESMAQLTAYNSGESCPPTLIVVLGMHRSGTSTLTRATAVLGAEFGSNLMPAIPGNNDKGFFEDLDVVALNEELLHAAGGDWHSMAAIDIGLLQPEQLDRFRVRAIDLLRAKCRENQILSVKDPRLARLLSFWKPVFACIGIRVLYLIAVRNPISVVQSLARRDGFPVEKSYILWLAYVVSALDLTQDVRRVLIDYDRLMDTPRQELENISDFFDLPLIESRLEEFESAFLDDNLRHTRYTVEDLQLVNSAPRQVKELYLALSEAASGFPDSPAWHSAFLEAKTYLQDIAPLLRYEWRLAREMSALRAATAE
ncbi:hypothetical protein LGM63_01210 [Burkholderia cepacia]|uniref:sulfotransferase family protein n=1 Tax=Burkholderia cepacia TaxID=292 RepID=UPI0012D9AC9D|nr:glycosyl transferase family 1 [Burkholderia cepacia]MCA7989261.1 hypothetical protein [Burkholderia cepacia]MCA8353749.1 hypothetical protein [Burkholderia cepacia]